ESTDPRQWEHVPNTLLYRRAIRELARFLGCEPTEAAVAARRAAAAPDDHAGALLRAARIERLLIDDGFPAPGEGREVGAMRRLEDRALVELLLWDAVEATAADPLPLQVHVGFGDPDLRLGRAGPAGLAPLIERFPATPVVLLHCYPFVREAGWMASVYANVH